MPYISEMLEIKKNFLKFKGYCHEKEENLPVERLLHVGKKIHLIRIDSVKQYDIDTSGSFYDEEVGGNICLFPSYIVEITFTPVKANLTADQFHAAVADIKAEDDLIEIRESQKWQESRERNLATCGSKSPIATEAESETD
jgi:hypothetical protein